MLLSQQPSLPVTSSMVNPHKKDSDHYPLEGAINQSIAPATDTRCSRRSLHKHHWQAYLRVPHCESLSGP